jgi:membrane fusion protein (multidrug efflux system)
VPDPFARSRLTLDAGSSLGRLAILAGVVALLAAWVAWFAGARVAVYAASDSARLQVEGEPHPVGAPVGGRVMTTSLAVGQRVAAGDILIELDATTERLTLDEERERRTPMTAQLRLLQEELQAQDRALQDERRRADATLGESRSREQQARAAADLAAYEARVQTELHGKGLVSEIERVRAANAATARMADVHTLEFATARLRRETEAHEQERLIQIARLQRELEQSKSTARQTRVTAARLEYDVEQRRIRAPIPGTLAEIAPLRAGTMVASGERLCTIVPEGPLKVVALFQPSVALGRVRAGQLARVRFDGFPWMQYGSTPARVSNVATELRDGRIRVELTFDAGVLSNIPYQHGLTALVDVEIERVSPAALVLRSAGLWTQNRN